MRNITLIIAMMAISLPLYTQDIIDPPKSFNKDTLSIYDNANSFVIGWNWGGIGRKMDEALSATTYHSIPMTYVDYPIPSGFDTEIADNIKGIPYLWDYTNGNEFMTRVKDRIMNGMSLLLEPAMAVTTADAAPARWNDVCGGVYGFQYQNWEVGDTVPTGNDFSRFRLHAANVTAAPVTVLENIYDGTFLHYLDYVGTNNHPIDKDTLREDSINTTRDIELYHPFNGKQWYFSVNLRAFNRDSLERHLNDTILSIELPYTMTDNTDPNNPLYSNGFIRFDSLPDTNTTLNRSIRGTLHNDYRGVYRALRQDLSQPTVFYITGKMLKVTVNNPDSNNITLSAFFRCVGDTLPDGSFLNNPRFRNDWWSNDLKVKKFISSIDARVKYYGKLDVCIDWFRYETPRARQIFHGARDLFTKRCLDTMFTFMRRNSRNPRLFRIYGADELLPFQYGISRYYNILLDTLVSAEIYIDGKTHPDNPPERYLKATASKEYWTGSTLFHQENWFAAPYLRKANVNNWILDQNTNTLLANFGYAGNNFMTNGISPYEFTDTLNSAYETIIVRANGDNPIYPLNYSVALPLSGQDLSAYNYSSIDYSSDYFPILSTQAAIEKIIYRNYYAYPKLLFNEKPWWANLWPYANIGYDISLKTFNFVNRPKTGEEIRLQVSTPIVLGAKGLLYYLKTRWGALPNNLDVCFQISDNPDFLNSLPTGESLVYSNMNGGDFVNLNDDNYYRFKQNYIPSVYNWDILNISQERIYLGIKSSAAEIYKFDRFIRANESTLLNLRLKAWYGKGFIEMYSQSPEITSANFLEDFVDYKGITTKKLYQPVAGQGNFLNEHIEDYDSSFFDIALHKHNDREYSQEFYIAVQSRRTDPLIYYYDTQKEGGAGWELRFFTTAEMDQLCRNGGPDPLHPGGTVFQASHWQQYWWKRLGAREITIPFVYKNPIDTTEYCLLRITELGKGTSLDNEWWRQAPFMQTVDTVIGQDRPLAVKLLPGEGKIFKVQVLRPPTNLKGKLDWSNQSKLIAYPIFYGTRKTDSIMYHLVYYKPVDDENRVFYVRSRPVWKDSPAENIEWEQEICVSDTIENLPGEEPELLIDLQCQFPSIVVRRDDNNLHKAYIVYSCEGVDNSATGRIAETILEINNHTVPVRRDTGRVLAIYTTDQYNPPNYGNPCINASANGNYYAWNDFFDGVIAAFKGPNDLDFQDTVQLRFSPNFGGFETTFRGQQSMNVYSNIEKGEDNCALAWVEKINVSGISIIDYTRLRFRDNNLSAYLPKRNFGNDNSFGWGVCLNPDTSIACIRSYYSCCFPVIGRKLNDYNFSQPFNYGVPNRDDIVIWQENTSANSSIIAYRSVELLDSSNLPGRIFFNNKKSIASSYNNLTRPTVNFGLGIGYLPSKDAIKMSFFKVQGEFTLDFEQNNSVTQLPVYSRTFYLENNVFDVNMRYLKKISPGKMPHLSNYPFYEGNTKVWANRQVFEHGDNSVPDIWASASGFYRKAEDEYLEAEPMVGFRINNDSMIANYMISLPKINEDYTKIFLPYDEIVDTVYGNQYIQKETDTLLTDWFVVGANAELTFKLIGRVAPMFGMYLEKQNDTAMTEVMLPESQYDSAATFRVILLNGLDENYRIVFINKNIFPSYYTEELYVGGIPISDTVFTRNGSCERIVNLNPGHHATGENRLYIIARPNPANDKIEVKVILPEKSEHKGNPQPSKFRIVLYGLTGEILFSNELTEGKTSIINTESYQPGSYFLRAEEIPAQWGAEIANPAVEKIIIER